MKLRLIVGVVLVLSLSVLSFGWWVYNTGPVNSADKTAVTVKIEKNTSIRDLVRDLKDKNLIRSRIAMFAYLKLMGLETKIQAGTYRLNPSMELSVLANSLTHGVDDKKITIPEGWRVEQVAEKIGGPIPASYEGKLFPDTYLVPNDYKTSDLIQLMSETFSKKVPTITKEQLIVASLVEREGKTDADRPLIASVIYNRLEIGMALNIDATIQYAIGYTKADGWWKKELTIADLKYSSPYNTYIHSGLPPGPICNPGLAAINAAINPAKSDYLYYISDKSGVSHFAKTLAEHNANVAKYLSR